MDRHNRRGAGGWSVPLLALALPVVLLTMLPSIIFGPLLSNGGDKPSGFSDGQQLSDNLAELNAAISSVLSEGLTDVLARVDLDFSACGRDEKKVVNPYGTDVVFNANAILSQYCAYKDQEAESISQEELVEMLREHKHHLYSFTFRDTTRRVTVVVKPAQDGKPAVTEQRTKRVRVYTIVYNGESYFADQVFALSDEQKVLAGQYARNLTLFLDDGVYQGLPEGGGPTGGQSYDGVVFTDGVTQVTYYNQLDERWKNLPYGTDNIGGYACGPTAMSIVVSSLTSDTVDPPHMARWAYDHGYWCSGNGSYHALIPGAAKAWGLNVEGCSRNEPQRIVDALADGRLVVAIMGRGHFTRSGHFIVLRGVTSHGTILVADPSSYKRSQKEWDLSIILDEAGRRAGSGGPFWIIGN